MALIFPVCRTWGPRHRSMRGPHLYTVVVGVLTLSLRILTLKGLYLNISSRSSLVISRRSKGCFSLIIFFVTSSSTLKSDSKTLSPSSLKAFERLLLLDNLLHHVLKYFEVRLQNPQPLVSRHVVVESLFDWGSVAKVAPVTPFHGLAQDVSRGVPEHHLALVVVKLDQGQGGRLLKRPVEVPKLAVDFCHDATVSQAFTDSTSDVVRCGPPCLSFNLFAVGQRDFDVLRGLGLNRGVVLSLNSVKHGYPLGEELRWGIHLLHFSRRSRPLLGFLLSTLLFLLVLDVHLLHGVCDCCGVGGHPAACFICLYELPRFLLMVSFGNGSTLEPQKLPLVESVWWGAQEL